MSNIDFEKSLNKEQLAAVTGPEGPLLVLAAAGTGKTRTLVYRVAYLMHQGIPSDRILLLTFTNRAAREMLERAQNLVGHTVSGMWGGTFHHMANRILRHYATRLGYPLDFTILDQDDAVALVKEAMEARNMRGKEFPKPEVIQSLFSTAANTEKALRDIVEKRFEDHPVDPAEILHVHAAFQKRKLSLGAMDFDDLLVNGLRLFREHPDALSRYQQQFRHVLVDEYQDTNTIQAEWVDRIASTHRNLMVVGDDFQSIYAWRGADYRNIMSFPKRYTDAKVFLLETNYRSTPEILHVANACIAGNPMQFQKTLRSTRASLRKPEFARMRDGDAQARYVAEQVRRLKRDGNRLADIVVLYRAHYHSMELQMNLTRERIPYVVTSGVRFFEQAHIKDVCALVRLMRNPEDELSFRRLLALLPKVGPRTAERLWKSLNNRFDAANVENRQAIARALPAQAQEGWKKIESVLTIAETPDWRDDPGEVMHQFVNAFYEDYALNAYENADFRIEDIREMILFTTKFESADDFLEEVALLTNLDAEFSGHEDSEDKLRLSTVHQAKGLEWNAVILIWVTDGMFPASRSIDESGDGEAEERRLFYVAVTRAKDELVLCCPEVRRKADGSVFDCPPSRFVQEIPANLLRHQQVGFI